MFKEKELPKELIEVLEKAGIKKDEIDNYMMWGVYKLALGVMKIKWSLEEAGVKGDAVKKKLNKIIELVSQKSADDLHQMMHKSGGGDWK